MLINRLLPKCNDRNKKPERPFSLGKLTNFTRKLANFGTFFKLKNVVNFSNSSRQYSVKINTENNHFKFVFISGCTKRRQNKKCAEEHILSINAQLVYTSTIPI